MTNSRLGAMSPTPADPLLSVMTAYRGDERANKIDLGVGVYKTADGQTPIFRAIRAAHERFTELEQTKVYLGPKGWPGMSDAAGRLILGSENLALLPRFAVTPTPGGCGALRLAGELLKRDRPDATIWVSDPTWANHIPIFVACGFNISVYPYFSIDEGLRADAMIEALRAASPGDIVLLHGCCHNPTGEDLTPEAWAAVTAICLERDLLPLIDIAYHGLADGLDEDAAGFRGLLARVPEAIICYSFSKNMGLYRDRVGVIGFLGETEAAAKAVDSHILEAARQSYSMPPTYGEALAFLTLDDPSLQEDWRTELGEMRDRITLLREGAAAALAAQFGDNRFAYLRRQNGMFSMLPLSAEQISALREEHAIYVAPGGRVNMCGLPEEGMDRFAAALATVKA